MVNYSKTLAIFNIFLLVRRHTTSCVGVIIVAVVVIVVVIVAVIFVVAIVNVFSQHGPFPGSARRCYVGVNIQTPSTRGRYPVFKKIPSTRKWIL